MLSRRDIPYIQCTRVLSGALSLDSFKTWTWSFFFRSDAQMQPYDAMYLMIRSAVCSECSDDTIMQVIRMIVEEVNNKTDGGYGEG